MRRQAILALLLALAICPYFVDLGGSSIWDANEAFYVETPREMIERGDYVSPTFNYEPRVNKPVLSYWIVAGFYHLFGVSVGVQRVPIAIAAVLLIGAAFLLAVAAYSPETEARGHSEQQGPVPEDRSVPWYRVRGAMEAGLWAALGLAIGPRLLMFARRIFIDMYITLFMALTLLFFALAERYPGRRRLFLVLMYAAIGLGVLTKGPVAIVLPGLVFGGYLLLHREIGRVRSMMLPAGIAIVLAIVLPWYAALYARHGWTYIVSFVVGENIGRYTEGIGNTGGRGPLFYLPVVFSDSFPWSLLLVPAGWQLLRRRTWAPADRASRVRTLLWLWILVIVAFFSLSRTKQDLYIFPIVAAVAALGGAFVPSAATGRDRAWLAGTAAVIGLLLAVLGGLGFFWLRELAVTYGIAGLGAACAVALGGGIATILCGFRGRTFAALAAVAATTIVLNWILVLRVLPSVEPYKPSPIFARTIEARLRPGDAVIHYKVAMPSMVYYLRRHIEVYYDTAEFREAVRKPRGMFIVVSEDDYEDVRDAGIATCVVERRPTFEAKLRDLLAREPLPEVLLLSTACS